MSKDCNYIRMIQSNQWKELRKMKLTNNPVCEDCEVRGLIEPATEVHHIIPVESSLNMGDMKSLMFSYSNLKSMCHTCHSEAHKGMKSHTRKGVRENVDKRNERFKSRYL